MRHNPERLAWSVLLTAFAIFCVLAVGFPLSVRSYLLHARRPLQAHVNAQRGTVRVERDGSSRGNAVGLDDAPLELYQGDRLRTGGGGEGLLTLRQLGDQEPKTLASVVVYDDSSVVLVDASAPRFGLSSGPYKAVLRLDEGRVRIEVGRADGSRPVEIRVQSQDGEFLLNNGSYAIEIANQQTSVTVRDGQAQVRTDSKELVLSTSQRAVVTAEGSLEGPLPAERNLVQNGDFSQGVDVGWKLIPDPAGRAATVTAATSEDDQPVAWFQHGEALPSEVKVIQTLNRNVKDLRSLVLHLKVRVNYQSLSVCGSLGSECPVMVRIDYIDAAGNGHQWVHGFYAREDPYLALPYYCTTCPDPSRDNHDRVPEASWFLYDSPNLMEVLAPGGEPIMIQSVLVYASGHSYDSMVTDVELLAQE
jgi:hypothetical protein